MVETTVARVAAIKVVVATKAVTWLTKVPVKAEAGIWPIKATVAKVAATTVLPHLLIWTMKSHFEFFALAQSLFCAGAYCILQD
jgi:hypothetical protein